MSLMESNNKHKRKSYLILLLITSFAFIRAGEYLVDYVIGDKDGKLTTPFLSSSLSIIYGVILISLISLVILRILAALRIIKFLSSKYTLVAERFSVFSNTTFRIVIFILALVMYFIQSYAVPMSYGRDHIAYLTYYFEYFSKEPVYHGGMVSTPPVAPFVFGLLLQYGGTKFLELLMAIGYSLSMVAIYNIGLLWNRKVAVSSVLLLLLYPSYALLYHQVSNTDALFAFGFILWCNYIVKTYDSPSTAKFAINGFIVFLLILTRPTGLLFLLLFVLSLFLLPKLNVYHKLKFSFAFLIPCVALMMLWASHNYIRYDDFTITRGSAVTLLYRLFVYDKIIQPENGKHSRELYEAIKTDLLPKEPYKSYGITIEKFFSSKYNSRMFADLPGLSDRIWGWDSDWKKLRAVAIEAIKTHPYVFIKNTLRTCYQGFYSILYLQVPKKKDGLLMDSLLINTEQSKKLNESGLPIPSEGKEIPRAYMHFRLCSPDNRMLPDPNSIELKFPIEQQIKIQTLQNKIYTGVPQLPVRDSNEKLLYVFSTLLSFFPRMFYWVLLSVIGFVFFADTRRWLFIFFFFMAFTIVCATYMAIGYLTFEYRVPFDPIFIIGGTVAFMKLVSYGVRLVN